MSNVIHVRFPTPEDRRAGTLGPVLKNFARHRRASTDAFWLKENAELLNILESTNTALSESSLAAHSDTYAGLAEQITFFPQYYRFLLSLALDLEALGLAGSVSDTLCDHILAQGLVEGETSDIQRLEAQRLLARRGRPAPIDAGVTDRALAFINRPGRFALPNKKAAYELTHIVFYLTEYGRRSVDLGPNVAQSLENVGIWAFLDGNADLLAEICIAMRYLSYNPSGTWESWIASQMIETQVSYAEGITASDNYHCVFMGAWLGALRGIPVFSDVTLPPPGTGVMQLSTPNRRSGALREMSKLLFALGSDRSGDWHSMAPRLEQALSPDAHTRLQQAAGASVSFPQFFESFARAVPA